MNKRQAKRLLNVSRSLREAPVPKAFDMGMLVYDEDEAAEFLQLEDVIDSDENDGVDPSVVKEAIQEVQDFCGTPACAFGHYASRRDLQKVVKIGMTTYYEYDTHLEPAVMFRNNREIDFTSPTLLNHFGITSDEMFMLFDAHGCGRAKTPVAAAQYIERFVESRYGKV